MNNIMVYAIADRYELPDLKRLAKNKFLETTNHISSNNEFAEMTRAVFSTMPDHDMGLREGTIDLYTNNIQVLMAQSEIAAAVMDNNKISSMLMTNMVQSATRMSIAYNEL